MPPSPPAHLSPVTLRWARTSVGLSVDVAAKKINTTTARLEGAETGDTHLTLRQAEQAAKTYRRPLADLFLSEPPEEERAETLFRRLPGAPPLPWSYEMHTLSRLVRYRQAAAAEIYDLLDERPAWQSLDVLDTASSNQLGEHVRDLIGPPLHEQLQWGDRTGYQPLREWTRAVERQGVLVMQDGTMDLDEMRGFISLHPTVPAIVVNTRDDPRARAFTVVHEFGHLLCDRLGRIQSESWLNDFAGNLLMPRSSYAQDFLDLPGDQLSRITNLALRYGVTRKAAIVRLDALNLLPPDDIERLFEAISSTSSSSEGSSTGGDYYRNVVSRLGPGYIDLVFAAFDGQALSSIEASGLLGVKINHLPNLRKEMVRRLDVQVDVRL